MNDKRTALGCVKMQEKVSKAKRKTHPMQDVIRSDGTGCDTGGVSFVGEKPKNRRAWGAGSVAQNCHFAQRRVPTHVSNRIEASSAK